MHKLFLIIVLLFFAGLNAKSQVIIDQTADDISVDQQGNMYLINGSNVLKYTAKGQLQYKYGNAILGSITSIDVTDPLRMLFFFSESNAVVYLNQQLAEIGEPIDLSTISDVEAMVVSYSSGGGFWAFDAVSMSIKQYSARGVEQKRTENLSGYLNAETPISLNEYRQNLYLQLPSKILVFDLYGTYLRSIPIKTGKEIRFKGLAYQYLVGDRLILGNLQSFNKDEIFIEHAKELKDAVLHETKLYLLYENKVIVKILEE